MSKATKASAAYARLKAKIERGEFARGERMTEARVSEILGVGRGPARETLLRLESEGLIGRPGVHQTRYVEYVEEQSLEDLVSEYELREMLDGLAARCAALNMTGRQIVALREIVSRVTECIQDKDRKGHVDALADFYTLLRSQCGNPLVMKACESCGVGTYYVLTDAHKQKRLAEMPYVDPAVPGLASVVDAIASHDPQAAETEMRDWTRGIARIVCSANQERPSA